MPSECEALSSNPSTATKKKKKKNRKNHNANNIPRLYNRHRSGLNDQTNSIDNSSFFIGLHHVLRYPVRYRLFSPFQRYLSLDSETWSDSPKVAQWAEQNWTQPHIHWVQASLHWTSWSQISHHFTVSLSLLPSPAPHYHRRRKYQRSINLWFRICLFLGRSKIMRKCTVKQYWKKSQEYT
jgi:hypothetical protein